MTDSRAFDPELKRIVDLARRRLKDGSSATELLNRLRPDPSHPKARWREDGPPGAAWRARDVPLLGLADLAWADASPEQYEALARGPLADLASFTARVAPLPVFAGRDLVQAVFGDEGDAEHDLFLAVRWGEADLAVVVFDWTGGPLMHLASQPGTILASRPIEYLKLFCALTGSADGRFALVDRSDLAPGRCEALPILPGAGMDVLRDALAGCDPPTLLSVAPNGSLRYRANILYGLALFRGTFEINHLGQVQLIEDEQLLSVAPEDGTVAP